MTTLLDQYDVLQEKGVRRVSPHTVPMLMPNGPAANVGLEVGARAGVHTPVSACASGAEAIGYAIEMIRTGRADVVVAGGTEAADPPAAHRRVRQHDGDVQEQRRPARAPRVPYDAGRDGFVLGEGAGVIVLESAEHAAAARRPGLRGGASARASPPTPTTSRSRSRAAAASRTRCRTCWTAPT